MCVIETSPVVETRRLLLRLLGIRGGETAGSTGIGLGGLVGRGRGRGLLSAREALLRRSALLAGCLLALSRVALTLVALGRIVLAGVVLSGPAIGRAHAAPSSW